MTSAEAPLFVTPIEVRGYELDSFGHVNNANYFHYLEHARWKMLQEKNITLPQLEAIKRWPVIISVKANYLKPTFLGDCLEVHTSVFRGLKTRFEFNQKIYRNKVLVFEATLESVFVDENGRPTSIPEECNSLYAN